MQSTDPIGTLLGLVAVLMVACLVTLWRPDDRDATIHDLREGLSSAAESLHGAQSMVEELTRVNVGLRKDLDRTREQCDRLAKMALTKDSVDWQAVARNLAQVLGDKGVEVLERQVAAHTRKEERN